MDFLKGFVELTFSPLGTMTLFLCGGFFLSIVRRKSRWGHRLLMIGTFLFLLFTSSPIAEILISNLERRYQPLETLPTSIQVKNIVVLSAYGEEHPTIPVTNNLSQETICRLAEGIRLYRRLPESSLVLSGGVLRDGDKSIANIMADFVREMGVPDEDILVEGRSFNTYENLLEVKKILGNDPFILVTSACHLMRAMAVARNLGMSPVAAPACIRSLWSSHYYAAALNWREWIVLVLEGLVPPPNFNRLTYLQRAYHEYLGYVWYKLLGRI